MTQEEKAKAYDEALTTAKRIISENCSEVEKLCLKCVFPELAESEDERIRKFLVDFFASYKIGDAETKLNGVRIDDILAYLEKQKEQKPAEWSAKGRRGRIGSTPEHIRKKAENFLSKMEPPYDADDICSAYETGAMENANSSWSEEDEKMLRTIISDGSRGVELDSKQISWLKSLRPVSKESLQPHWKPSEEQMESLAYAIQVLNSNPHPKSAKAYQDLQTLYKKYKIWELVIL